MRTWGNMISKVSSSPISHVSPLGGELGCMSSKPYTSPLSALRLCLTMGSCPVWVIFSLSDRLSQPSVMDLTVCHLIVQEQGCGRYSVIGKAPYQCESLMERPVNILWEAPSRWSECCRTVSLFLESVCSLWERSSFCLVLVS